MLLVLLITPSVSLFFERKNYVTPNKAIGCSEGWSTCLTLQEYANQPDKYFTNHTIFYFQPGSHRLNSDLNVVNLHHLTLQGLQDSELVNVLFGPSISVTWKNCSNIEISSISFSLLDYFIYGIVFKHSNLVQISNVSVFGNESIGCSSIMSLHSTLGIKDSNFVGIQGTFGAALMIVGSCVIFTGNNKFVSNTALFGGSLYLFESTVTLNGISTFMNNNSSKGSGLDHYCTYRARVFVIIDNYMKGSGGAIYCKSSTLIINGEYSIFANNSAEASGGAIAARINGSITIQGFTLFERNVAYELEGGAISFLFGTLILHGNISFINNKAIKGGALSVVFLHHDLSLMGMVEFYGNRAWELGGAVFTYNCDIAVHGNAYFQNNRAVDGGAMYLDGASKLILSPMINISFVLNYAENMGGALYYSDSQCSIESSLHIECFLSIWSKNSDNTTKSISLLFLNNSAGWGSILYGGQLNKCRLKYRTNNGIDKCGNRVCNDYSDDALGMLMKMSKIIQPNLINGSVTISNISSQAEKMYFCQGQQILQDKWSMSDINLYPGEQFSIRVIAFDQSGSPVPTIVFNENIYAKNGYHLSPPSSSIDDTCSNISFQLHSAISETSKSYGYFKLYPQNTCGSLTDGLSLEIFIKPCPLGFNLSDNHQCNCNKKLLKFTQKCCIDKSIARIERMKNNFWISQVDVDILLIHEYRCPLDYCKDIPEDINLNDPSVQCDFNRMGIVCEKCLKNFSSALGSLHCIPCDNKYTALILVFTMAGVALIALIFLLRLTVSVGTLSGLIFYANIIQMNNQVFFPRATINFFTVFISWLNLDLGIETCFYDGMDIYAYSWFQFLFPFYLWFLVGCIILACRYFQSIAKRLGQNPVTVLATLVLMSYSKMLSAVIVPLTWTHLTYYTVSNETQSAVWLYDASINFFREPKHIALGFFAIASLVIFVLPYILLLFFGHWLQRYSNWWILSWLNKLKPFMDAYHAPYQKHTRYWTGLLLISRLGLFLMFANDSESVNITTVSSVSVALLAIRFRVYEHFYNDILESSYILNLGIFSVATFYLKEKSEDANSQLILSSISVGIAFITFIGILIFHISLVFKSSSIWKVHMLPVIQKSLLFSKILRITPVTENKNIKRDENAAELHTLPTSTEIDVDLREPLLDISESQIAT